MGKKSELHRIQYSFRAVMEAMARPGKVVRLECVKKNPYEEAGINSPLATLIQMFVDQAVSFAAFGTNAQALEHVISEETHASSTLQDTAAFLIGRTQDTEALKGAFEKAPAGTPHSPHKGATFLVACDRLSPEKERPATEAEKEYPLYWVSVEGPGVEDSHVFGVSDHDWLWARKRRDDEYPCGVEIILVDQEGRVVAIPRTSFVSLLAMEGDSEAWVM